MPDRLLRAKIGPREHLESWKCDVWLVLTAESESPMNWNASFDGTYGRSVASLRLRKFALLNQHRELK